MGEVTCSSCGRVSRVRPAAPGRPVCPSCRSRLPWIVEAGEDTFAAEVDTPVPVVADFWAPWCAPCRMIAPGLEALATERAGDVKVVKVNVDEAPGLAARYRAMSIPLVVVLSRGEEVDRLVGALPPRELAARLAPALERARG